jgi:hypothetical protein
MLAFGRLRNSQVQLLQSAFDDLLFWHAHAFHVLNRFWPVTYNGFIL